MCSLAEIKRYRLVKWELSPKFYNERLCDDDEYTIDNIKERYYRYECSILHCRSLWDLRMTPSGLFCKAHYLPWLHTGSDGRQMPMKVCSTPGCLEPPVSKRGKCRKCCVPDLTASDMALMTEGLISLNRENPEIFGGNSQMIHMPKNVSGRV
jgi:hypothetical protein